MTRSSGRVAVIGANAQGLAVAVDLTLSGADVFLWDRSTSAAGRSRRVSSEGVFGETEIELAHVTPEMREATNGADIVFVSTFDVRRMQLERELLACLDPEQTVIFARGGSLGALRLITRGSGWSVGHSPPADLPVLVDLSCLPYSARLGEERVVSVKTKRTVGAASWPAPLRAESRGLIASRWLDVWPARDVLHCALLNPNFVLHPAAMALNLGAFERGDSIPHEGLTDAARRLAARIDIDRRLIMESLGYPPSDLAALLDGLHPVATSAAERAPEAPLRRFVDEDVLVGLVLLNELGRLLNVETPMVTPLIELFAASLPADVWATRFDMSEVGWSAARKDEVLNSLRFEESFH